jgi:hypothetical protein
MNPARRLRAAASGRPHSTHGRPHSTHGSRTQRTAGRTQRTAGRAQRSAADTTRRVTYRPKRAEAGLVGRRRAVSRPGPGPRPRPRTSGRRVADDRGGGSDNPHPPGTASPATLPDDRSIPHLSYFETDCCKAVIATVFGEDANRASRFVVHKARVTKRHLVEPSGSVSSTASSAWKSSAPGPTRPNLFA